MTIYECFRRWWFSKHVECHHFRADCNLNGQRTHSVWKVFWLAPWSWHSTWVCGKNRILGKSEDFSCSEPAPFPVADFSLMVSTQVQKRLIIIRTWATKKTTILSSEGHCDYTEMFETRDFPTVSSFISTSNKSLRNRCGSWWPQGAAKRAATFVITCVIKELGVQIDQRSQRNIELQCNICPWETHLNHIL